MNDDKPGRLAEAIRDWNRHHWWAAIPLPDGSPPFEPLPLPAPSLALPGDELFADRGLVFPHACCDCGGSVIDFACHSCGATVCPICQPEPEDDVYCGHRVVTSSWDEMGGWVVDGIESMNLEPEPDGHELRDLAAAAFACDGWVIGCQIDSGGMGGGIFAIAALYVPDLGRYSDLVEALTKEEVR